MSALIAGHPGSCSSAALTLSRAAAALRAEAERLAVVTADSRESLTGRGGALQRRRSSALAEQCRATADVLDQVGRDLQAHATDLADLIGRLRPLEEAAARHRLHLEADGVRPQWGITGEADPRQRVDQERVAAVIAGEWSSIRAQIVRRRDALTRSMLQAQEVLAEHAAVLRG